MRSILSILILLITVQLGYSQYPTYKATLKEAIKAEQSEDWYMAYRYYEQLIAFERDAEEHHYKAALNAMKLKAYVTADEHLQHLDSLENAEAFEDLTYYRAVAAHHRGRYDESLVLYKLYISEAEADAEKIKDAEEQIESVEWALFQPKDTLVQIENLGEGINSQYGDFSPAEIADERFLYATDRALIQKDDYPTQRKVAHVYYSEDGHNGSKLPGNINEKYTHTSNVTFTPDRSEMYYTKCEYLEGTAILRCDIFKRAFQPDSAFYGPPEMLPAPINMPGFSNTQPNIGVDSSGQLLLFFASDRTGGKGGFDLYYCTVDSNAYGEVINIDTLNTPKDEWSPFLHEMDQDLYFSSYGYLGFGSLDIYKSAWRNGNPDQPSNIGQPENSSFDDVYYALSKDGTFAYMASNREGSQFLDSELEACCFDLYKAHYTPPMIELLVSAYDKFDTTDLLGSTITLIDKTENITLGSRTGDSWDDYIFNLEHNKDYQLIAELPGYHSASLDFDTDSLRGVEIMEKRLFLDKIVPLEVSVYDENTDEPLPGALVKLFEITDSSQVLLSEVSNPDSHIYNFNLIRGHQYLLFGTKSPLYDTATLDITSIETGAGDSLFKRLDLVQLAIRNLERVFPLVVFFDNDQPNPKTKKRTTDRRYGETYHEYMDRKDEFIENYTAKLGGTAYGDRAKKELNEFFTDEVEVGYNKLNYFMEQLHAVLKGGLNVEVSIKGYTSPIAKGDYNLALGQRRVQCLKNEFLSWNNGALQHYVDIGKLVLKEISFGETKAPIGLSDSAFDKRNSVYSPLASKERRVEVIAVRRMARTATVNQ